MKSIRFIYALAMFAFGCDNTLNRRELSGENFVIASYRDSKAVKSLRRVAAKATENELIFLRLAELETNSLLTAFSGTENQKVNLYEQALRVNPHSREALYGLTAYGMSDKEHWSSWLERWKAEDPTNSLPYYLSAFNKVGTAPTDAWKEIEVGNAVGRIVHRPVYERIGDKLTSEERLKARLEWRIGANAIGACLIRLQQELETNIVNGAELVHLLVFDNQVGLGLPTTPVDLALGTSLALSTLRLPTATNVFSRTELEAEINLRKALLEHGIDTENTKLSTAELERNSESLYHRLAR